MKRMMIVLLISIPAASVVMGAISLYFAFSGPDQEMSVTEAPLDKTSWQQGDEGAVE